MRHGPKNPPRDSRSRPTAPSGVDPTRAGIRALDCGDETWPETKIVRRAAAEDTGADEPPDAGPRDEPQQSV